MKKYDNREEMKRILLAGNLNSNNDDSWNVKHILNGATPDFTFHGYNIRSGASKLCLCNDFFDCLLGNCLSFFVCPDCSSFLYQFQKFHAKNLRLVYFYL